MSRRWHSVHRGTDMFTFTCKLKLVKHELKSWSRTSIGNTYATLSRNVEKINYMEDKLLSWRNTINSTIGLFVYLNKGKNYYYSTKSIGDVMPGKSRWLMVIKY